MLKRLGLYHSTSVAEKVGIVRQRTSREEVRNSCFSIERPLVVKENLRVGV